MRIFGRMQEKSIKAFSKLLFTVHVLLSIYTIAAYVSVYVSPANFWPAGFVALSLPVVIIIHLIFFVYSGLLLLFDLLRDEFRINYIPFLLWMIDTMIKL